jgi:glycerol-3-phosphate dehydrogenase
MNSGLGINITAEMNRNEQIQQLAQQEYDLCIIGAGASGAGCALDAALRGLKVVMVDSGDFACGTSSRSTKLIHGGVRYLEQAFKNFDFAQLKQVRHGLEERHAVLANAPHLSRPLALVTPVFSWIEGLYFTIGLKIYAWFASSKDTLPKSEWLSKKEVMRRIPGISPKLHSAVLYYDGQLDDARYALALALSAAHAGTTIVNHLEVSRFETNTDGRLHTAVGKDLLTGTEHGIKAKVFLNCTGPYADHIRLAANADMQARIRPSKGVHAVLPLEVLGSKEALLIPKTPDGRVVFAIPFFGKLLLGTTDEDYSGGDAEPLLERRDVDYLLETLAPYVGRPVTPDMVTAGFGGLRPLIQAVGKSTKGLVRDHEVEHDPKSNLFSLLGGKWTTYRLMAKDAVDTVCAHLGMERTCTTENHVLVGGNGYRADFWENIRQASGLDEDIARHLNQNYGSEWPKLAKILQEKPENAQRLVAGYPFIRAEVVFAARHEMCCTIRDFFARRIRLEIMDWSATLSATDTVAHILAHELGWTNAHAPAKEYMALIESMIEHSKKG